MVVRGYGAAGMVPFDSPIEVYLPCWPWGAYLGEGALENGVDACISSWHRMAPNTTPAMAKIAGNYLGGQLIKMEALKNGFAEAIALGPDGMTQRGLRAECVHRARWYALHADRRRDAAPGDHPAQHPLAGTRRGHSNPGAAAAAEFLYAADEVFFTGTAAEVTPVRSVDRITVGAGKVGPITLRLQKEYLDIVKGAAPDRHGWLTHVLR